MLSSFSKANKTKELNIRMRFRNVINTGLAPRNSRESCIRLAREKFELTNQDSASGKGIEISKDVPIPFFHIDRIPSTIVTSSSSISISKQIL